MQPLGHGDPQQLGGHRLVGVLGRGGQGSVYLGEAPDGRRVAVKMLHDRVAPGQDAHRRFLREADAARRVAPFSTARVLEVGIADERPFLVSEFISGPSLDQLVVREGPRSGSGLVRLAVSTLTALAAIHRAGIVHRDFKPSNVIMGPEGPVVIDFGIARALDHTTTHGVLGTPAFMAPEQFEGAQLTAAADVFSWAITMVYAASGRPAFAGDSMPALMHAIMTRDPDLSGVPEELRGLLAACLAKPPSARPSATDLLGVLTGDNRPSIPVTRPSGSVTRPHAPFPPPTVPHPRGDAGPGPQPPVVAAAAGAALAALLCLVHALMTWRGVLTGDYVAFLDWNGWEGARLGALTLAGAGLAAVMWRESRAAALVSLGFVVPLVVHLFYVHAVGAPPEGPWLAVGALAGLLQGAVLIALALLSRRWSGAACAIGLLAGAGYLVETVLWVAMVMFDASESAFNVLNTGVGINRLVTAAWLVVLGAAFVRRAVRARRPPEQGASAA